MVKYVAVLLLSTLCLAAALAKPKAKLLCTGDPAVCEAQAKDYLENYYEPTASAELNKVVTADWEYNTDLLNATKEEASTAANIAYANFIYAEWEANFSMYDWESFPEDSLVRRQLKFLNAIGTAALPEDHLQEYNLLLAQMNGIYGTAKVCPFDNQDCDIATEGLPLEPSLEAIIATSTNYDELTYVWQKWRDHTGKLMRDQYIRYIDLSNEAARLNGYDDMGDFWIRMYESETFRADMETLWQEVKDLYDELHAYVRFRLQTKYPEHVIDGEPLPASILGNMWAQTWEHVYNDVVPFPDAPVFDVTDALKERFNETQEGISDMFDVCNEFFVSLGLEDMGMSYGEKAMIVKPADREVVCHASAWDFSDGEDYRIKMCTSVNMEDFITAHHELGHIQYFLNYKHQPIVFRDGANPGFHEAIGDVIALSVATPKHMVELGYMNATESSTESTLNYLMKMALEKVAFLPFGYLIDSYRWGLFDGSIPTQNITYNWLKMRSDYQGVVPPVVRSEIDFDAGAKYHVPGNTPYIRYFVSFILQFQLHQSLCETAGQYEVGNPEKPLHDCDIYRNLDAGDQMRLILESGFSKTWEDLLLEVIGQSKMSAAPITEYFAPLTTFLAEQRATHGYTKGWRANAFEDYYQA